MFAQFPGLSFHVFDSRGIVWHSRIGQRRTHCTVLWHELLEWASTQPRVPSLLLWGPPSLWMSSISGSFTLQEYDCPSHMGSVTKWWAQREERCFMSHPHPLLGWACVFACVLDKKPGWSVQVATLACCNPEHAGNVTVLQVFTKVWRRLNWGIANYMFASWPLSEGKCAS